MAHIVSVIGHRLRDMLLLDRWEMLWERAGHCHLRSPRGKHRGFPLNSVVPLKLVKSISETAGWSTDRFEELRQQVLPVGASELAPGSILTAAPKRLQ